MDTLTSLELAGTIIHETSRDETGVAALGYTIGVIFGSFTDTFQALEPGSLVVSWDSLPDKIRNDLKSPPSHSSDDFYLYDSIKKLWNWPLFAKNTRADDTLDLTTEQRTALFFNAITNAAKRQCLSLGTYGDKGTGGTRKGTGEKADQVTEVIHRHWMAEWSQNALPGSEYIRKPDLILVDDASVVVDDITWRSPRVIGELTKEAYQPAGRLGKTMDTKAYIMLVEQPWRRFVLGISIANDDFRLHFYDRSGGAVSPPFNIHQHPHRLIYVLCAISFGCRSCLGLDLTMEVFPELAKKQRGTINFTSQTTPTTPGPSLTTPPPTTSLFPTARNPLSPRKHITAMGTMGVGDAVYELMSVLFSSSGFLGRGTVCYIARRGDVSYVIKDHWVQKSKGRDLLNETKVMQRLGHIDGVPKLHGHCVVHADEVEDCTERYREEKWRKNMKGRRVHMRLVMTPHARPMTMFRSKRELVTCIRDVIVVLERAAEEGILHRDCSLNNVAIEDLQSGSSRGLLLDWEFGVEVKEDHRYGLGGTGTLPFMSIKLLSQINRISENNRSSSTPTRKSASTTRGYVEDKATVVHTHADDIESLFYVFVWILIRYDGPLGHERQFDSNESTLLDRWNELSGASDSKVSFLVYHSREEDLRNQISPYFENLFDLVNDWRKVVAKNSTLHGAVTFADVLPIFDHFLANMPLDEQPPEMTVVFQDLRIEQTNLGPAVGRALPVIINTTSISGCSDSESPVTSELREEDLSAEDEPSELLPSQKRLCGDVRSMDNLRVPKKRFRCM